MLRLKINRALFSRQIVLFIHPNFAIFLHPLRIGQRDFAKDHVSGVPGLRLEHRKRVPLVESPDLQGGFEKMLRKSQKMVENNLK